MKIIKRIMLLSVIVMAIVNVSYYLMNGTLQYFLCAAWGVLLVIALFTSRMKETERK